MPGDFVNHWTDDEMLSAFQPVHGRFGSLRGPNPQWKSPVVFDDGVQQRDFVAVEDVARAAAWRWRQKELAAWNPF